MIIDISIFNYVLKIFHVESTLALNHNTQYLQNCIILTLRGN